MANDTTSYHRQDLGIAAPLAGIKPTRRGLLGVAAAGMVLPTVGWAAKNGAVTPAVAAFTKEAATVRDARFGLGSGADGRALLPLHANAKRIWLDTSAKTNGNGLSPTSPLQSEAAAYALLKGGDQLMIASTSVLTVPMPQRIFEASSGISSVYPTVIQSYDRSQPLDETRYGLFSNRVTYLGAVRLLPNLRTPLTYFALRGIRFDHSTSPTRVAYSCGAGISWLLIEQCGFFASPLGLNAANDTRTHVIRQTVFQGQWNDAGHAQGIYTTGNFDTVIEDCIFYHCGWKMGASRSDPEEMGGPTKFNHSIYAAVKSGGILRRCVFLDPSSHGAQLRGNWHSHDNSFISCPLALLHGGGTDYALDAPDGVMALCYRNVIANSQAISPVLLRGIGIDVGNTRTGSLVEQNLIVSPGALRARAALAASATLGANYEPNPTVITFRRNTNAWTTATYDQGPGGKDGWPNRVFVTSTENITPADKVSFADPTRDGLSAAKALGFQTLEALGYGMVADPTRPWALQINDHIRAGFTPVAGAAKSATVLAGAVSTNGQWNV
jgi:hypothetical protein